MNEPLKANDKVAQVSEFRKQIRQVVSTSFILVLVLVGAMALNFVRPPLAYVLFCVIFIVDFSLHAYLIWRFKEYWFTDSFKLQGIKARILSIVYGFLALVCVALAIFILTR